MDYSVSFDQAWSKLEQSPSMRALCTSSLARYQSVARALHASGGGDPQNVAATLGMSRMRIAQAILNKHCGSRMAAADWRTTQGMCNQVPTWEFFVPRRIRLLPEFARFAECLRAFIAEYRPEPRLANNIRHQVALLWDNVLQGLDADKDWHTMTYTDVATRLTNRGNPRSLLGVLNRFLRLIGVDRRIRLSNLGTSHTTHPARGFTPDEIRLLMNVSRPSAYHHLLVVLLAQTGLRCRAVAWLRSGAVFDQPVGTAVEKGMRMRQFPIGPELRHCLERYRRAHVARCEQWLFPSRADRHRHVSASTIRRVIGRLCHQAGISTRGTRGFRKFVVRTLVDAGNAIEYVSKWLGHRRVSTTYMHYWDATAHDVIVHS